MGSSVAQFDTASSKVYDGASRCRGVTKCMFPFPNIFSVLFLNPNASSGILFLVLFYFFLPS